LIINQVQKGKKQEILDCLEMLGPSTSTQLCEQLGVSRQALNLHLRELISNGSIIKTGATRAAKYYLLESGAKAEKYNKTVRLANLDENAVYHEIATILNLGSVLSSDQESIVHYGFTEMLNNAIDHSKRTNVTFLSAWIRQKLNSKFETVESGYLTRLPPGFLCRMNTQR